VQNSVNVSLSGGFTFRRRWSSDLGYKLENGGFQVLFQNSAGANQASHSVGNVDSFLEFKGAEEREQNKTHIALLK
jgi:hypothetical protein